MKKLLNLIRKNFNEAELIKITAVSVFLGIILAVGFQSNKSLNKKPLDFAQQMAQHVESFNILSRNNKRFATGFHIEVGGKVFMITNRHVCDANIDMVNPKIIQFENHLETIIAIDPIHDLCMTTSNRSSGLKLASEPAEAMERITLIGFPRGIQKTIREGRIIGDEVITVSGLKGIHTMTSTQISTPAYGGNSGSPLINAKGEVVGVLHAGNDWYALEPFMVPHRYLKAFIMNTLYQITYPDYLVSESDLSAKQVIPETNSKRTMYGR